MSDCTRIRSKPEERGHVPLARAVFVTGKGGVGKTLVAAGLAVAAAESEGTAVLVEFGDGQAGRRVLPERPSGVKHIVLDPNRAVSRASAPVFGSKRLAKLVLDNFVVRPLVRAAPAIRELAVLELARQVVADHPGQRVVFDMPASGHSVAWLKITRQVREATRRGPVHELCAQLEEQLLVPGRASVVVVTLPERLVLSETLLLCATIETEIGLSVDRLVVNRVPAALPPGALSDAFRLSARSGPTTAAAGKLVACLEVRSTVREEVLAALDATVHSHGGSGDGDKLLTLLPFALKEPTAVNVAAWLVEEGAA